MADENETNDNNENEELSNSDNENTQQSPPAAPFESYDQATTEQTASAPAYDYQTNQYQQPQYQQPQYQQNPYPGYQAAPSKPNEPWSLIALILGIVGLVTCQLASPVALYMGIKSRQRVKESNGQYDGDTLALVGVITGAIGTAILGIWLIFGFIWLFAMLATTMSIG